MALPGPKFANGALLKKLLLATPQGGRMISHRGGSNGLKKQPGRKSSLTPLGSSAVSKSLGQTKTLDSWLLNLYTIFHQGLGYTLEDITSSCLR